MDMSGGLDGPVVQAVNLANLVFSYSNRPTTCRPLDAPT